MEYTPIPKPSFNTEKWFTSIFKSNEKGEIDLVNKHSCHLEYHKIRPLTRLLDTKKYNDILHELKNCIIKPQVYANGNVTGFGYTFHICDNDGICRPCYSIENCVFERFCSRGDWDRPYYSHQERRLAWQNECLRKNIESMKRTIESITLTQQKQTEVINKFIDPDVDISDADISDADIPEVFVYKHSMGYIRSDGRRPCDDGSDKFNVVATIICFCGDKAKKKYKGCKSYLCCNNNQCSFFTWFPY